MTGTAELMTPDLPERLLAHVAICAAPDDCRTCALLKEAAGKITALKEKVKRQAEALRPFAGFAQHYSPTRADDFPTGVWVTVGDLRRAAQEASE